jgi:hypothetical protein
LSVLVPPRLSHCWSCRQRTSERAVGTSPPAGSTCAFS